MSNDENKQQKGTERYSAEFFGKLAPYIADIDITDINCNGKDVWINHIHKGRYMLDKEELDLIWDKYYKNEKNHTRNKVCTGLGLSIVKNILIKHGYNYGVESTKGKGTKFYFDINI